MEIIPFWRRPVRLNGLSKTFVTEGLWVCGASTLEVALPEPFKQKFLGIEDPYTHLNQLIENRWLKPHCSCLYYNPRTETRALLITDAEFFCDEVSDIREFCSGSALDGCESHVRILCRRSWREVFRKLRNKALISHAQAEQICDLGF